MGKWDLLLPDYFIKRWQNVLCIWHHGPDEIIIFITEDCLLLNRFLILLGFLKSVILFLPLKMVRTIAGGTQQINVHDTSNTGGIYYCEQIINGERILRKRILQK